MKKACIFYVILDGIPSSLIMSVKNKGVEWVSWRFHVLNPHTLFGFFLE